MQDKFLNCAYLADEFWQRLIELLPFVCCCALIFDEIKRKRYLYLTCMVRDTAAIAVYFLLFRLILKVVDDMEKRS